MYVCTYIGTLVDCLLWRSDQKQHTNHHTLAPVTRLDRYRPDNPEQSFLATKHTEKKMPTAFCFFSLMYVYMLSLYFYIPPSPPPLSFSRSLSFSHPLHALGSDAQGSSVRTVASDDVQLVHLASPIDREGEFVACTTITSTKKQAGGRLESENTEHTAAAAAAASSTVRYAPEAGSRQAFWP